MKYNGVILRKINAIEERLIRLHSLLPLTTEILQKDYFLKSGIERTLQVCVEAVIDIANRIISIKGYSPPTSSYDSIKKLETLNIIKDAEIYENMIKFRNFVVHRYESVDNSELALICNNNLSAFERFIKEIQEL